MLKGKKKEIWILKMMNQILLKPINFFINTFDILLIKF